MIAIYVDELGYQFEAVKNTIATVRKHGTYGYIRQYIDAQGKTIGTRSQKGS